MKKLNPIEVRILGVLIEKESTTPDHYPLTLNSLSLGANQKSNRSPVTSYDENELLEACESLMQKHYVIRHHEAGARSAKYLHQVNGTEGCDDLKMQVLSSLFLKGLQTPGEIFAKIKRSCPNIQLHDVNTLLDRELNLEIPWFIQLKKEPGKKESRWCHTWADAKVESNENETLDSSQSSQPISVGNINEPKQDFKEEFLALRDEVEFLRTEVEELHEKLDQVLSKTS